MGSHAPSFEHLSFSLELLRVVRNLAETTMPFLAHVMTLPGCVENLENSE